VIETPYPAEAPVCQRRQFLGPFKEEEEGIRIVSDVVQVEDEDPATPGSLREDRARRYVSNSRAPWLARDETPGPNSSPVLVILK